LDLVHAQRVLQSEARQTPVHQAQLDLRIWQRPSGSEPVGRGLGTGARRIETWAPSLELPVNVTERQERTRILASHWMRHAVEQEPGGEEMSEST
jgi:hypothetical protein